jgi:NAD-dependent oxidoreductase involved in siderophore biosynthesis
MKVTITATFDDEDQIVEVVRRQTRVGEKNTAVLRRILNRYVELIARTSVPPSDVVALLNTVVEQNYTLLMAPVYPERDVMLIAVANSTLEPLHAAALADYIRECDFAQFAKLVEAVENMRLSLRG